MNQEAVFYSSWELPKSLFGKYPYMREQSILFHAAEDIQRGAVIIKPEIIPDVKFLLRLTTPEWRRKRSAELLTRALDNLRDMGV